MTVTDQEPDEGFDETEPDQFVGDHHDDGEVAARGLEISTVAAMPSTKTQSSLVGTQIVMSPATKRSSNGSLGSPGMM